MPTKKMPHDKLFRQIMRSPDCQKAFICRHLPQEVQDILDLNRLAQVSEHFAQAHQSLIPDCVLSAPLIDGLGRFYLCIEQETNPRRPVLKRLMLAKLRIAEFDLNHYQEEKDLFPLVWCVLFCTGAKRYRGVTDLFEGYSPKVKSVLPLCEGIQVVHVQDTRETQHSNIPELDAMELLMKHIRDADLVQVMKHLEPLFAQIAEKKDGRVTLNALFNYALAHGLGDEKHVIMALERVFHDKVEDIYMSIAQALKKEGEKRGIEKGIERGMEKGIEKGMEKGRLIGFEEGRAEVIQGMLAGGADPKYLAKTTGLSLKQINALHKSK